MTVLSSDTVKEGVQQPQRPLISIVLPTFNGSRFLRESIDSILAQTYREWELIVVDDASTDNTPQIIAEYRDRDKRIRSVRHDTNKRIPGGLNTGFSAASGEFFTWTSDDNIYRPNAIDEMCSFLQSHDAVDLVYTDTSTIDADGRIIGFAKAGDPSELAFRNPVGASFMYRRKVHETLGGYADDMFLCEDFDFWVRAANKFKIAPFHRDLYLYRAHAGSLSATRHKQVIAAMDRVMEQNLSKMSWVGNRALAQGYAVRASTAVQLGDFQAARRFLLRALGISAYQVIAKNHMLVARIAVGRTVFQALRAMRHRLGPGVTKRDGPP